MDKKLTYVDALNWILDGREPTPEILEKLTALRDVTEKRNSGKKKLTPTQRENEVFKTDILNWMEDGKVYSATEIGKGVPSLSDLSPQRVNAIITLLKNAGQVVRTEEKRKAYFSKAVE